VAFPRCGFDGKLPSRGDFVGRGLPRSFVRPWQAWVDAALAASRLALAEAWLAAWDQTPAWRFALPAGVCGPDAVLGLLMPSLDRAGRRYPLTVAAVFVGASIPPADEAWLDAVEPLALNARAHDWTPEALMLSLEAVPAPDLGSETIAGRWWTTASAGASPARLAVTGLPEPAAFATIIGGRGAP